MNKIITKQPNNIIIKQQVRFGKPCLKGTRIAVTDILNLLYGGYNITDVPTQYPGITIADAKQALHYAANVLGKEEILQIES